MFNLEAEGDYITRFFRAATMPLEVRGQRLEISFKPVQFRVRYSTIFRLPLRLCAFA
jgi:hypothetical protein